MPWWTFLCTEYFTQHDSKADRDATKNGKEKREKMQSQKRNHSAVLGHELQGHQEPWWWLSLQDLTSPLRPEQSLNCLLGRTQIDNSSRKNTETVLPRLLDEEFSLKVWGTGYCTNFFKDVSHIRFFPKLCLPIGFKNASNTPSLVEWRIVY